jgi:acetyl esterase/lipase
LPTLVYFHGGGWVAGSLQTHDRLCRSLAEDSGCRIIAVDYRLAPENRFPAGLEDCCDALLALGSRAETFGVDRRKIAVGGDSAGAHLAVAACRLAGELGASIACQLLLCPVLDPWGDWPSRRALSTGFFLEETAMADYLGFYGASASPADPRLSPLRMSNFGTLPPAHIHTAEFDPVRDEGHAYADALASAGVPVRYTRHAGMIHHFYGLTGVIPSARRALATIAREFGEALRAP